MEYWIGFVLCSLAIVISGSRLSYYGDIIAELSGIGRAWIGLILMASITSLPELVTGISSVVVVDAVDIALGDVMGSCVYNLFILAIMDMMNGERPLFYRAFSGHLLSAGMGVILISIVLISILLAPYIPQIAHVGLYTPVIIVAYIIGIRAVYYYEQSTIKEYVEEAFIHKKVLAISYRGVTLKRAVALYSIHATVIVIAAVMLPYVAERLAVSTGLGSTFMGSVFVAMTTSLPEVVVSIAAVRLGARDMAISNMLGSNMFNILIVAVDDLFYLKGSVLSYVSDAHLTTGLSAIMMTGVVIIGLTYPPKRKLLRVGIDSIVLTGFWLINMYVLYITRGMK